MWAVRSRAVLPQTSFKASQSRWKTRGAHTSPSQLSSLCLTPGISSEPAGAAGSLVSLLGLSDKALHFSLWGGCVVLGAACVISWGDGSLPSTPPHRGAGRELGMQVSRAGLQHGTTKMRRELVTESDTGFKTG